MTTDHPTSHDDRPNAEADALLAVLSERRQFLLGTARGLSDDQARLRPTASSLSVGGLIKHVSAMEAQWVHFIEGGAQALPQADWEGYANEAPPAEMLQQWADGFTLLPDETLAGVLAGYADVATRTERVVRGLTSLDVDHELPPAPWFAPGSRWSARRVVLHMIGETAHHSGHADIIRETIDGQKTMG